MMKYYVAERIARKLLNDGDYSPFYQGTQEEALDRAVASLVVSRSTDPKVAMILALGKELGL